MEFIDRYIEAVTSYLPESSREDVAEELRKDIEQKLPSNPTDEEVFAVLEELGDPEVLSEEYPSEKNYLIGPKFYRPYLWTLKLVVTISVVLTAVYTVFSWMLQTGTVLDFTSDIVALIIQLFTSAFNSAIQAAFWVTIGFFFVERSGATAEEWPFAERDWTPNDLSKDGKKDRARIPRSETAFELLFLVIFAGLFFFRPQWIGMYSDIEAVNMESIPLFNVEQLQLYLPIILLIFVFELVLVIWKLVVGRWYKSLAITNLVFNFITAGFFIFLSLNRQIFNKEFFNRLTAIFTNNELSGGEFQTLFIRIILGIVLLMTVIDSIYPFFKINRSKTLDVRLEK